MKQTVLLAALFATVTGCGQSTTEDSASIAASGAATFNYLSAVESGARTEKDKERDAGRKPDQVLEFFDIEPGMTVLDMFAGGGYYTEIISNIVGPDGRVVSHSNEAYRQFVGDEATQRYSNGRLPNVEILMAENNELALPDEEFDAITMILAYHDIYYEDPDNGWPKIDGPRLIAELYSGLKPGGVLGVVDHVAQTGAPRQTGGTLHRIDPAIVISELELAGFVMDAESPILRNPDDDHLLNMSDPAIRGNTDRIVMRFIKPE